MADMRGIKDEKLKKNLIDRFELDPKGKIRKMSKGMKQKLAIIAAFMHDPKVYILDEPTSGLDPLMQKNFIELINEEKKRGKTILMSSHIFEEIERTSDRVGVIREGRIVAIEEVSSIKQSLRKTFIVTVAGDSDILTLQESGLEISKINGLECEIVVTSNYKQFIETLGKCQVVGLDVLHQSLEQVFMKYYGKGE
jgi:ABC-2 type transport system ATP-binding protein